jgi:hypothetical protein
LPERIALIGRQFVVACGSGEVASNARPEFETQRKLILPVCKTLIGGASVELGGLLGIGSDAAAECETVPEVIFTRRIALIG